MSVRCCSGTSYEARLRTRTRHGTSHYSDTWQFRTWSPWTPAPPPVTLDTADMAAPLVLLAAAILATFVLLALEIAADKTIDSGARYLRQKLLHLKDGRLGAKVDPQLR